MKQNKLTKFIAKVTGEKQEKYVDLRQYIKSYNSILGARFTQRPSIELDVNELVKLREQSEGFAPIYEKRKGDTVQHVLEFGFYPFADENVNNKELRKSQLTGRSFNFYQGKFKNPAFPEYRLSNGDHVVKGLSGFNNMKLKQVLWIINNWKHLSKSINPDGDGKDSVLKLELATSLMAENVFFKQDAFMVSSELLELSGVKNVNNLISNSKQDECEKVL